MTRTCQISVSRSFDLPCFWHSMSFFAWKKSKEMSANAAIHTPSTIGISTFVYNCHVYIFSPCGHLLPILGWIAFLYNSWMRCYKQKYLLRLYLKCEWETTAWSVRSQSFQPHWKKFETSCGNVPFHGCKCYSWGSPEFCCIKWMFSNVPS